MLKNGLIFQIIRLIDRYKDELGGGIMTKFDGLRSKTYAYLIDNFEEK